MRSWTSLGVVLFIAACGGPPIEVSPSAPAATECQLLDPPKLTGLSPEPHRGPLKLSQILTGRGVPTEAQWQALPPGSDAALVQLAGDAEEPATTRARAMSGIAVRRPEGGHEVLRAILADADADATLRRGAARALGHAYLDEGTGTLGAAAADEDPLLREAVVQALAPHVGVPAVRALLQARRSIEEHLVVLEALDQALRDKDAK